MATSSNYRQSLSNPGGIRIIMHYHRQGGGDVWGQDGIGCMADLQAGITLAAVLNHGNSQSANDQACA